MFLMRLLLFFSIIIFNNSCTAQPKSSENTIDAGKDISEKYRLLFDKNTLFKSDGFDFPVGKPNAEGYYNAQGFGGKNHHLGDDWNGKGGGNSDLGHPIYAASNGYVSEATDKKGGWGRVIRIVHYHNGIFYESLYAHCDTTFIKAGDWVKRGQKIATIGNNNGMYLAHLHYEIRSKPDMPLGGGYSTDTEGYLNPTIFTKANRPKK
jgi:murein DD-endopeptidase MepM/ murein hydrolase activator NlpD